MGKRNKRKHNRNGQSQSSNGNAHQPSSARPKQQALPLRVDASGHSHQLASSNDIEQKLAQLHQNWRDEGEDDDGYDEVVLAHEYQTGTGAIIYVDPEIDASQIAALRASGFHFTGEFSIHEDELTDVDAMIEASQAVAATFKGVKAAPHAQPQRTSSGSPFTGGSRNAVPPTQASRSSKPQPAPSQTRSNTQSRSNPSGRSNSTTKGKPRHESTSQKRPPIRRSRPAVGASPGSVGFNYHVVDGSDMVPIMTTLAMIAAETTNAGQIGESLAYVQRACENDDSGQMAIVTMNMVLAIIVSSRNDMTRFVIVQWLEGFIDPYVDDYIEYAKAAAIEDNNRRKAALRQASLQFHQYRSWTDILDTLLVLNVFVVLAEEAMDVTEEETSISAVFTRICNLYEGHASTIEFELPNWVDDSAF